METNVEEIDRSGQSTMAREFSSISNPRTVRDAAKARRESFASANPLSLGSGVVGSRGGGIQTPLGWLTGKLTGAGAR